MAVIEIAALFLLLLVLGSLGCGWYLTAQWIAWHRQGKKHQAWSRPLVVGWGLLITGMLFAWLCTGLSSETAMGSLGALTFTIFCAALLTWPYALGRYRETVAELSYLPQYGAPQENVWPPPPTNLPH